VLRGLARILVPDREAEGLFWRAGAPNGRVEVAGSMGVLVRALPHNAAERDALAQQLDARPVWLAVGVPEAEEAAVLAAQHAAHRLAHRLLLVLVPADPARGAAVTEAAAALGLRGGRRSADAEPGDDDQIYVADTEGELGLWYRLAPVSFMGGTLEGPAGRDPLEPAALGSAILHGPRTAPHDDSYARLAARRASQRVTGATGLAEAVIRLLNPERAARMARGGWEVATEGGEVTDRVAGAVLELLGKAGR
jgi:3-deoxy-D-manno-octulosonic-acid transferase